MFSSGLSDQVQLNILNRFKLRSLPLPVRYLGLPLCSKKLSVRDCDSLLAQVRRKLNCWMNRHLSMAGRLQLISSTIPDPRESSNTTNITSTRAMCEFASCLSDIGLFDLASQGPHFTWSNHRPSDPIGKKIDRCLVNDRSQLSYPKGFCSFEPPEFSDHTPCHIWLTSTRPDFGSRAFMFPSYLANLPSFVPTIKDCWIQLGAHAKNLTSLCYKLKQLKFPIKTLCKKNFSQIERRVQEAKVVLDSHQIQALNLPSEDNIALEN
ncbi:hypothetical protein F2Q69_00001793 [Brassica cretica]|uniref:Endonuclease/exonuclease/phosphatase domain-containing protein n=1 Tax=Brassica cretica TaxID=69181 RepID=A0A8S9PF52_BRACR|nr:hypothetical protein F2Q69_00001793 [Brassica cretica]